ncbi:MAG: GNAT family N-acetyltransferase [Anaerolineae bacterium]|nr:GNAT family N-acetyltransferase [Anaerolineae bacterium]
MMTTKLDALYRVQRKDVPRAGAVLTNAFQHDPVWSAIFDGVAPERRIGAFETPVRYCLKYGEVCAPSAALEGVAAWVPGELADMTPWRMLVSGAIWSGMKMGMTATRKMMPVFAPIEKDRKATMQGKSFIYLLVIGVAPQFQGQGFAGKLVRALIDKSGRAGVPIYLETETESNVRMYEHLGFEVVKEITLPIINLPMWEMVRGV